MAENSVIYTAVYDDVNDALTDLDSFEKLHDEGLVGDYDAAVVDKENGEPHIVKRADHPKIRVVPELFGGGALPRKDLNEAAQELTENEAGLVVVGEWTIGKAFDKAVTHATKTAKHELNETTEDLMHTLKKGIK